MKSGRALAAKIIDIDRQHGSHKIINSFLDKQRCPVQYDFILLHTDNKICTGIVIYHFNVISLFI